MTRLGCRTFAAALTILGGGCGTLHAQEEGEEMESFVVCDSVSDLQTLVDRITDKEVFAEDMGADLACRVVPLTGSGFSMEAAITDRGEPATGPGLTCLEPGCAIFQNAAGYIRGQLDGKRAFAVLPVAFVQEMLDATMNAGGSAGSGG